MERSGYNLPDGVFEKDLPGANDRTPVSEEEVRAKDEHILKQMGEKLSEVEALWDELSDKMLEQLEDMRRSSPYYQLLSLQSVFRELKDNL